MKRNHHKKTDMPHFANLRDGLTPEEHGPALPYLAIIGVCFVAAGILIAIDPLAHIVHYISAPGIGHE